MYIGFGMTQVWMLHDLTTALKMLYDNQTPQSMTSTRVVLFLVVLTVLTCPTAFYCVQMYNQPHLDQTNVWLNASIYTDVMIGLLLITLTYFTVRVGTLLSKLDKESRTQGQESIFAP